jgi:DNA-binding NarL/FixJ family response regulator
MLLSQVPFSLITGAFSLPARRYKPSLIDGSRLSGTTSDPDPGLTTLTIRETDVLTLVATGLRNQQIADRLGLTLLTVKAYMKAIMAKLNAESRTAAVAEARTQGLLP